MPRQPLPLIAAALLPLSLSRTPVSVGAVAAAAAAVVSVAAAAVATLASAAVDSSFASWHRQVPHMHPRAGHMASLSSARSCSLPAGECPHTVPHCSCACTSDDAIILEVVDTEDWLPCACQECGPGHCRNLILRGKWRTSLCGDCHNHAEDKALALQVAAAAAAKAKAVGPDSIKARWCLQQLPRELYLLLS